MKLNTQALIISSASLIILGLGFLWFGLKPETNLQSVPSATTLVDSTPGGVRGATGSAVVGIEGERALVTKVIDGDTIVVNGKTTVRFVGMDTPETVDPRRPVGCFGKEASNETKNLLTSKEVILQKDVSETDKYKRLLRYVFLPLENGQLLFVNDYLVRAGFAKVYTYPPDVKFDEQFRQAEREAREGNRGLWGKCL